MDQAIPVMNQVILDLNQKINVLTAQVAYLTEQAEISERNRQDRSDLIENVMPIAKDAMQLASDQFEEIQDYLKVDDLLRFIKKLALRRPQLEMMLDLIGSATELGHIMNPIAKEGVDKLTSVLTDLEAKGYFGFGRSSVRIFDNIVTSFTEEDVDRLGDNIVLILNTVKDMTQPEIMTFIRNTLHTSEEEVAKPVNTSMWAILGQLRDPAVRRGLALTLRVLRVMGQQGAQN